MSLTLPTPVLFLVVMLCCTVLAAPPAGASSGCDNPDDLPVLTEEGFSRDLTLDGDLQEFPLLVDVDGDGADVEVIGTWEADAGHVLVSIRTDDGDGRLQGRRIVPQEQPMQHRAYGAVEDCDIVWPEIQQLAGAPDAQVHVTVSATPRDVAPFRPVTAGAEDAVVVAIIDDGFNPYHLDFRADGMPNRLPLDRAPHQWLSGFPDPDEAFSSYGALDLTLPTDPDASALEARLADADVWSSTTTSVRGDIHYYWTPGTKAIGAIDFTGRWMTNDYDPATQNPNTLHGSLVAGAAIGNTMGHCPECVYVSLVVDQSSSEGVEQGYDWAMSQPWIDVVSSSTGWFIAQTVVGASGLPLWSPISEHVHDGGNEALSLDATLRGQQSFHAGGNGYDTGIAAHNLTYHRDHVGFDWTTTVGGIHHDDTETTRAIGVDVAGPSASVPTTGGDSISGRSRVGGTSLSTPMVSGTYARALLLARQALPGPSRIQADGVIATGAPRPCGECPLADGQLTRAELVDALYAAPTVRELDNREFVGPASYTPMPDTPVDRDREIALQGFGSFLGRQFSDVSWNDEIDAIVGPLLGERAMSEIPTDVMDFQIVDSFCKQRIQGWSWDGALAQGVDDLPGTSADWPIRSSLESHCQAFPGPPQ